MNDADVTRLLDRVADEVPVREPPMDSLLTASRRALRRRRAATVLGLVAGVAVLAGGGLAASGVVSDDGHPPTAAPQNPTAGRTGALPDSGSGSCVEQYEPAAVDRRAFAFDGVVVEIGPSSAGGQEMGPPDLAGVTFEVREWFSGGEGETVTVDMPAPVAAGTSTVGTPSYAVGSRLLVSGESRSGGAPMDDPIAWGCGFTRYWDAETAASWR